MEEACQSLETVLMHFFLQILVVDLAIELLLNIGF
jgi:hypothetical protein